MTARPRIANFESSSTGIAGAAERSGLTRSAIRRLIASGALPATRTATGSVSIAVADVDALG